VSETVSVRQVRGASEAPRRLGRDPVLAYFLALGLTALVLLIAYAGRASIVTALKSEWQELLFWAALTFLINLFTVTLGEGTLTLDMPVLLATALLYPPAVATGLAFVSAVDVREFSRKVSLSRALFNRSQVALTVFVASVVFRGISSGFSPWPLAVAATVAAVAASHSTNILLVGLYMSIRQGVGFASQLRRLVVGRWPGFLATYLGYCIMAIVIAFLFLEVGAWAILPLIVPVLVARLLFVRTLALTELTRRLKNRERLLERLSERIVDERRDERTRIAGELHDDVLQRIISLRMTASLVQKLHHSGVSRRDIEHLVTEAEAAIEELRSVIGDLKGSPLGRGGLVPTLRGLAVDLEVDWKTPIYMEVTPELRVPAETQLTIYQVAREALINALKHASASRIEVHLIQRAGLLSLSVQDDGIGFDEAALDPSRHFGLGLLRERVRLADGKLSLETTSEKGTTLKATFPVEDAQ
jgi:signal transduction histidine kinase